MEVRTKLLKDGFSIGLEKSYDLIYPCNVWSDLSIKTKKSISDNLVYSKLASYGAFLYNTIKFQSAKPYLKSFLDKSAVRDFPRFAEEDKISARELIKNFLDADFVFGDKSPILPNEKMEINNGFVIGVSFGKDSLLSYGIAKELCLSRKLVFIKDFDDMEWFHKRQIIEKFEKEFKEEIVILNDGTDDIHRNIEINKTDSSGIFGSNAMNSYLLMLLPFAYNFRLKHIIFGNEQNFNDFFVNEEGFKVYPSYEQSSEWMNEQNRALSEFTDNKIQISSFIESLYNIAEVKVLFNRYPEIAKYQMSCSHSEIENKESRWCYTCPMCAKAFLYLKANGINPRMVDFKKDMFGKECESFYPLFNKKPKRVYEKPKAVRDEQLLAFYLAFRNGDKGYLIDEFRKKFLEEAKEREDELFNKFFKVYDAVSISDKIKERINSIYKEELNK